MGANIKGQVEILKCRPGSRVGLRIVAPLALAVLLSGCGASMFSTRATNPVISDQNNPGAINAAYYGVIPTTAGRRTIFVAYKDPSGRPLDRPGVCAEPPPDAIDALASALIISASGKAGSGPEAQAQLANSFAVSSALGLYRSQGLQFLRDQTFQLCIRALVTRMPGEKWETQQAQLRNEAIKLIEAEMHAIEIRGSVQCCCDYIESVLGRRQFELSLRRNGERAW